MPRSFLPPKKKKEGVDKSGGGDDAELAEFLGRDYWLTSLFRVHTGAPAMLVLLFYRI